MSMQRRCDIFKASDQKWYMILGNFEHAYEDEDCSTYGPFLSEERTIKELDRHSNPGGFCIDDNGTRKPPILTSRRKG